MGKPEINTAGWLRFIDRVSFFKLCHLFKVKEGLAPTYLSRDFLRTRDVHSYSTRGSELNFNADSDKFPPNTFHYTAIRDWNGLPDYLKRLRNINIFKRKLKRYFLS